MLVRHGFGEIVGRAFGSRDTQKPDEKDSEAGEKERARISRGERIRLVAQELGPSFVKLGQIASTRTDVVPADIVAELKKLQDEVPPVPFSDIKQQVESSLGAPIADVFARFDEKPLASASIGQVHRAALKLDGSDEPIEVVVKVQRPGVGPTVVRDLELLHMMAAAVERAVPETKIYSPVGLVNQFDRSITSELNFLVEADHCERFAKNFEGHPEVRFPKIYRQASSRHVLVQEFFDGKKITETKADGKKIAKASVAVIVKMIFEDGFFHADPHPGNVIILGSDEDPVVGLIDTGMVGRLSPELRDRTIDLMIAAARKDTYGVADALYAIARPTKKVDLREYRAEVATLADKYLGRPLGELDLAGMLRDIVQGAMKYGLEIPPDFLLVGKALMTMEVVGKQLDPELDVFAEGQPYFVELVKRRYSPERIGMELWRGVEQVSRASGDLPLALREVLDDLRSGRLTVRMTNSVATHNIDRVGRRIFSGLVAAALFVSGVYLVRGPGHQTQGWVLVSIGGAVCALHWLRDALAKPPT
ncbi:MAG TPA: AarF/ABC1/UbiB kinase family protein [Polyangiaceae bacterium]